MTGKTLGLYFSASWCPPCASFTPKLKEIVQKLREQDKNFEIIFISSDKDEDSFKKYSQDMDWLSVPFKEAATRAVLQVLTFLNPKP